MAVVRILRTGRARLGPTGYDHSDQAAAEELHVGQWSARADDRDDVVAGRGRLIWLAIDGRETHRTDSVDPRTHASADAGMLNTATQSDGRTGATSGPAA